MKNNEGLFESELWTQNEVANYFRVVPGTIKNWRERGLLSYWQAPGSTRILYRKEEVLAFQEKNITSTAKKGGNKAIGLGRVSMGKSVISTVEDDWRI